MATQRVMARRIGSDGGGELAQLVTQARAVFQRMPISDLKAAASRFSLVAHLADDAVGALISLWPEPPFPWLDALAVLREELVRPALDALMPCFLDAMRKGSARQVLISAPVHQHLYSHMLRVTLDFGFRPLADFRRFRKLDFAVPRTRERKPVLREAFQSDLPALCQIDSSSFSLLWRYGNRRLEELLQHDRRTAVAVVDGCVVGYCSSDVDAEGVGHVKRIAVLPIYRGLAIGATLLRDAIQFFELAGAKHMELRSERGHHAAWRLFARFGFHPVGPDRRIYGYDLSDLPSCLSSGASCRMASTAFGAALPSRAILAP